MAFECLHRNVLDGLSILTQKLFCSRCNGDVISFYFDLSDAIHTHRHSFAGIDILFLLHVDGQQFQRKNIHLLINRPNEHAAAFHNPKADLTNRSIRISNSMFAPRNHQNLVWADLRITARPNTYEHEQDKYKCRDSAYDQGRGAYFQKSS